MRKGNLTEASLLDLPPELLEKIGQDLTTSQMAQLTQCDTRLFYTYKSELDARTAEAANYFSIKSMN